MAVRPLRGPLDLRALAAGMAREITPNGLAGRCSRHAAPSYGASAELRWRRMRLNFGVRVGFTTGLERGGSRNGERSREGLERVGPSHRSARAASLRFHPGLLHIAAHLRTAPLSAVATDRRKRREMLGVEEYKMLVRRLTSSYLSHTGSRTPARARKRACAPGWGGAFHVRRAERDSSGGAG
jgi:hypothetical protein